MEDRTVIARATTSAGLAYLFWTNGKGRGSYARLVPEGATFGTAPRSDVRIDDGLAAAEQARIRYEGDAWYVYDLAAANTTLVGGQPVYRRQLEDRDAICFGRSEAVFRTVG